VTIAEGAVQVVIEAKPEAKAVRWAMTRDTNNKIVGLEPQEEG
jgi:hypothetical protein